MCWPRHDDPLLGCVRQRALLQRSYGPVVVQHATAYARRLPQPLAWHDKMACFSVAMKYAEDEPLVPWDLFPGLDTAALARAEWRVLEGLEYRLRVRE